MAAATKAEENPLAGLSDLTSLINLFTGQKTTTSTSQQGMQALLQNLISGTQGLSAVTSGSKIAGGYNSATQSLMTNDFLTRAAAQAAAGTQTKQVAPQIGGNTALLGLGMMGAKSLLGPTIKTGLKKAGLDTESIGTSISDAIFGVGSTADAATSAAWGQGAGLGGDILSILSGSEAVDTLAAAGGMTEGAAAGLEAFAPVMEGGGDLFGGLFGGLLDGIFEGVPVITDAMLEEAPFLLAAL